MRQSASIKLAFIKIVALNKDLSKVILFSNFPNNKRVLSLIIVLQSFPLVNIFMLILINIISHSFEHLELKNSPVHTYISHYNSKDACYFEDNKMKV